MAWGRMLCRPSVRCSLEDGYLRVGCYDLRGGLLCCLYGERAALSRARLSRAADGQECHGEHKRRHQGECRDHDSRPCQGPALAAGTQMHDACNKGDEGQWCADERHWDQEELPATAAMRALIASLSVPGRPGDGVD